MKKYRQSRAAAVFVRAVGYIAAMGAVLFFALYMSASVGWTFFYVLAAAPVFSLIITFVMFFTGSPAVSAQVSASPVYKKEEFFLRIKLENKSIFPMPAVIVSLDIGDGFECDGSREYRVGIAPKSVTEFSVPIKAVMWGSGNIGVEKVRLCGYLGLMMLNVKGEELYSKVKVFPDIPDMPSDTPLIRNAADTIRFSDESEDTKESDGLNLFGGMPGYTHREYTEGDPIRRINWKLSSKRDTYMVRLDDEIEAMQQVIVLDSVGSGDRMLDARAVEGVLAIVFAMFRLGFESTVWYNTENGFVSFEIKESGDIDALRTSFADLEFADFAAECKDAVRIPTDKLMEKGGSGVMLVTSRPDEALVSHVQDAKSGGLEVTLVSSDVAANVDMTCYIIGEDFSAERI